MKATIDTYTKLKLQEYGFEVYAREDSNSHVIYSDGYRFATLSREYNGHYTVSTLHKPTPVAGTGFRISESKSIPILEELERGFQRRPYWATAEAYPRINTYESIDEYNANPRTMPGYKLVEPIENIARPGKVLEDTDTVYRYQCGCMSSSYEYGADDMVFVHDPDLEGEGYTYYIYWETSPGEAVEVYSDSFGFNPQECQELVECLLHTQAAKQRRALV